MMASAGIPKLPRILKRRPRTETMRGKDDDWGDRHDKNIHKVFPSVMRISSAKSKEKKHNTQEYVASMLHVSQSRCWRIKESSASLARYGW